MKQLNQNKQKKSYSEGDAATLAEEADKRSLYLSCLGGHTRYTKIERINACTKCFFPPFYLLLIRLMYKMLLFMKSIASESFSPSAHLYW